MSPARWVGAAMLALGVMLVANASAAVPRQAAVELPTGMGETVAATLRDTVYVGIYFVWVYDFDLNGGSYSTKCWIWFRYRNPALDPAQYASVFNSKEYSFVHRVHREIDGVHWTQVNCTAVIRQRWALQDYPFDRQTLRFRLAYAGTDTSTVVLLPDTTSVYDPYNHPEGWKLTNFRVLSEPRTYGTAFGNPAQRSRSTTVSMFMATMDLQREGGSLFFNLFTGMYAAFLISWLSLFIHPGAVDPRFGLSVGGLFACVGNKYIVDSILPDTVRESLVDILHAYTFVAIIATISISVVSLYYERKGLVSRYQRVDRIAAAAILLLYTGLNLWLVLQAGA